MIQLPPPTKRDFYFSKAVTFESMQELIKFIHQVNEQDRELEAIAELAGFSYEPKPMKIYIDSPGGAAYPCFGAVSVMLSSKTPIHTYSMGMSASCGYILLICGSKRFAHKYSSILYHQVSSMAWGTLQEMEEDIVETKRLMKILEKLTLERTNITREKLREVKSHKFDWWMDAKEALKFGVVNEIIK